MDKVIVIIGPTAVGKTKTSIDIAKKYNGEIISGDSIQVYKQLTIGSAKITKEEQDGIPHHLLDCLDYCDSYSVAEFQRKGRACIKDIIARGKIPIVCGGTGLYIKALLYDYVFEEQQEDKVYEAYLESLSNEERYELLKEVDLESTEKIHINNQQRVKRALVMAHLGKKKSDIVKEQEHKLLYDAFIIGLTMDREVLYNRINYRVELMFEEGLVEELNKVVVDENTFSLQSMQGIGYKEFKEYYSGSKSLEEVKEAIKKNSRNFAKRQYTWFRNQLEVHWYDVQVEISEEEILKDLKEWL